MNQDQVKDAIDYFFERLRKHEAEKAAEARKAKHIENVVVAAIGLATMIVVVNIFTRMIR